MEKRLSATSLAYFRFTYKIWPKGLRIWKHSPFVEVVQYFLEQNIDKKTNYNYSDYQIESISETGLISDHESRNEYQNFQKKLYLNTNKALLKVKYCSNLKILSNNFIIKRQWLECLIKIFGSLLQNFCFLKYGYKKFSHI